jgi:hypothetical protein
VLIAAGSAVAGGVVFAATPASRRWRPARATVDDAEVRTRPVGVLTPGLLTLLTANFGAGLGAGLASVAVPAVAVAAGAASLAGLLFAAQSAGDIVGGFLYGGRRWRLPVPYRLMACQTATVVGTGLLVLSTRQPLAMLPLMFAIGLFQAPGSIAGSTLLDVVVRKGALGLSYTSVVAAGLAGNALGSSVGGGVQHATGTRMLFAIAAATTAAALVQTYWRRRTLSG